MLGAIIGDISGSVYEFSSHKSKEYPFFPAGCTLTDDTVMTVAVACACLDTGCAEKEAFEQVLVEQMHKWGRQYPDSGYGGRFSSWLMCGCTRPYGSYGNGSAMRVAPVAWAARSLKDAETYALWSAEVTHDHPEGIRGAQAVAAAIFLAREGKSKDEIRHYIEENYYTLNFTVDEIRPSYRFDETCQGSVPQALVCFLEAENFEDAVRNAVSLGGDADTQAAIAGSVAEAFFGIPEELSRRAHDFLDDAISDVVRKFHTRYMAGGSAANG